MKNDDNYQLSTVNSQFKDGYKQTAPSTGSGQGLGVIPEEMDNGQLIMDSEK